MKTDPNDPSSGLTKREYFSAIAMQGILASAPAHDNIFSNESIYVNGGYLHYETIAILAVASADALIAELNKDTESHKPPPVSDEDLESILG
jgi:hypothetical protein